MYRCEKCGTIMVEDYELSSISYDLESTKLLDSDGLINYKDLPKYMVFSCLRCGESIRVDIQEIIESVQQKIIKRVLNIRLHTVLDSADRTIVDEASGVDYCGLCPGVIDESGTCYNDVIKQCVIRKAKLNDL